MAVILQKLIKNERERQTITPEWHYKYLDKFGLDWKLFPYQIEAINNTIQLLYLLYGGDNITQNKENLLTLYRENGLTIENENDLSIKKGEDENYEFLNEYYKRNENIEFINFINRAAYWMATGSGKTLVMIKLFAVLGHLINNNLIPQKDILVLAPKEEILNQIKEHVDKFNKGAEIHINLRNIKEYERAKNQQSLFSKSEITVFYYRADNISAKDTIAKKKDGQRIDYETIYNNGNWYLILDEAHKGEKDTSSRQQYYSALTHNGFLFNFSATFTDELDKTTTIIDYKLDTFLKDGYGKMLYVTDSEYNNFNKNTEDDYTDAEQKNIITQSLIILAIAKQRYKEIRNIDKKLYHSPLLITLANSVNTDNSDLKFFYVLLSKIARGINFNFETAKNNLVRKIGESNEYLFELGNIDNQLINDIRVLSEEKFRKLVFNSRNRGNIEVIKLRDNTKELAFKLTNSNKYFMLIHASDIVKWEENVLEGYNYSAEVEKSFFSDLDNRPDINILLGSRIFAEGWDTNRPNVINFINIGVSEDAQKYVLQSIGRGIRIEPLPNKRKRFNDLMSSDYTAEQKRKIKLNNKILESLFVFATNKEVVKNILGGLEKQAKIEWMRINEIKKNGEIKEKDLPLFIPVFNKETYNEKPFWIGENELKEVKEYIRKNGPKVLLLKNIIRNVRTYNLIKEDKNFKKDNRRRRKSAENIIFVADNYFNEPIKKLSEIKILDGEILHYKEIRTSLEENEVITLENEIANILQPKETEEQLQMKLEEKTITVQEYTARIRELDNAERNAILGNNLGYKLLAEHYYKPILFKSNTTEYQHIIKKDSEINFIEKLIEYSNKDNNKLKEFKWWYFSKIEQNVDKLAIPYFDSEEGEYRNFFPDFIFWLKKDNKYYIIFIDPHGVQHIGNSTDKIDGYNDFAEDLEKMKGDKNINVKMYYYNEQNAIHGIDKKYEKYWECNFDKIFDIN